jgi:hypothetical protein
MAITKGATGKQPAQWWQYSQGQTKPQQPQQSQQPQPPIPGFGNTKPLPWGQQQQPAFGGQQQQGIWYQSKPSQSVVPAPLRSAMLGNSDLHGQALNQNLAMQKWNAMRPTYPNTVYGTPNAVHQGQYQLKPGQTVTKLGVLQHPVRWDQYGKQQKVNPILDFFATYNAGKRPGWLELLNPDPHNNQSPGIDLYGTEPVYGTPDIMTQAQTYDLDAAKKQRLLFKNYQLPPQQQQQGGPDWWGNYGGGYYGGGYGGGGGSYDYVPSWMTRLFNWNINR